MIFINKILYIFLGRFKYLTTKYEIDLQKHETQCPKNPGHTQFIPAYTFCLENLPEDYRDVDLYEYIKSAAYLTVRVGAPVTTNKPIHCLNSEVSYELFTEENLDYLTGSGMIVGIEKQTCRSCPCKKCSSSKQPSPIWWRLYVLTAAHVVGDENAASYTTLRLFFDQPISPKEILNDVQVYRKDLHYDLCELCCLTCDSRLANNLEGMITKYKNMQMKFYDKDLKHFCFIVSHPHGYSKQISIGSWEQTHRLGKYDHQYIYNTCTCPGSSGAVVHCVGHNWRWNVHCGVLNSGLNISSIGPVLEQ